MKTFLTCLLTLMAAVAVAQTKIDVTLDHADAMYKCNEQAVFTVTVMNGDELHKAGTASVRLSNDGLTTISTKQVDLAVENPFTVTGTMDKPGILSLDVDVAAQPKKLHKVFGAAFEPFAIQPAAPEPDDFMQFWMDEFKKCKNTLSTEPELTPLPRLTNDKVEGFKVSFPAPAGKIYGFLTVPKAPGKYPALVSVPGAGPSATEAPRLEDFVYLVMNVHTYDPDIPGKTSKESYNELNKGGMYMYKDIPDREKTYFHHSVIGIIYAIAWLGTHEKVARGCIGYHGSSQGGAFGFIIGGLNPGVCAFVCNVPAMCDHLGYKQGRLAGWPQFCRQMKNSPEIEAMAQYYDAMNFAAHIRKDIPVRVIVGLADRTCSPSSVYAAYNRIPSSDKKITSEVGMGHEVWPSYSKEIAWMKNYLKKRMEEPQKDKRNEILCATRLKQMSIALLLYIGDQEDAIPAEDTWQKNLYDYIGEKIFTCPENGKPYHYNRPAAFLYNIKEPSRTIVFYEDFDNHNGKVNIAFLDGHLQSYPVDGCKTIEELAEHNKLLLKAEKK
ncbi:MAG: acetylxylan esterase [Victivallales bacterium]|nr:acetylxylan esterase [Victivallales bacterium]